MRIAFINNNNNLLFSAARYLRDRGHDITVCVMDHEFDDAPHFHPSADTFDLGYQQFTKKLTWGEAKSFARTNFRRVAADLRGFDILVGAGTTPAFTARIGRKLDVFVPYGSDLFESPFTVPGFNRRSLRSLVEFPYWLRRGIRDTRVVYGDLSPVIEPPLKRLGYTGRRVVGTIPSPYLGAYNRENLATMTPRSAWAPQVRAMRERVDVLVHAPARHVWANASKYTWTKGNDKFLRALAAAKTAAPTKRFGVIFYEYGRDVEDSRKLIAELNLTDNVLWLPRCNRRDVMCNLSMSDLACGELGETSWYTAGTILEPLCAGVPLIHRRDDKMFEDAYSELYPLVNIRSHNDIAAALTDFSASPTRFQQIGKQGSEWFQRNVAEAAVVQLEQLLLKAY